MQSKEIELIKETAFKLKTSEEVILQALYDLYLGDKFDDFLELMSITTMDDLLIKYEGK